MKNRIQFDGLMQVSTFCDPCCMICYNTAEAVPLLLMMELLAEMASSTVHQIHPDSSPGQVR